MCKLDLRDAYFCVPLSQDDRKRVMFRWEGTLYQFLCQCFGLEPTPYVLTKLLKISMALLRRIGIRIVIYLDDMLIIGMTREEISFTSVPGICYKSEKVSDDTSSGDRISGNDSQFKGNDYFPSTEETTINKTDVSGFVLESRGNSFGVNKGIRPPDINSFVHSPAKLHCHFLQQQIQALKKNGSYGSQVLLNKESQLELLW